MPKPRAAQEADALAARVVAAKAVVMLAVGSDALTIGGDVGQQVNGDQTVTGPMTFNVGSKPRKN